MFKMHLNFGRSILNTLTKSCPRTCRERWVAGGGETSPARSARISNATKSGPAHATRGGSQETKKRAPQGARASRMQQRAAPHMPREVGRRRRRNEPRKERAHLECNKERPRTCHERWVAGDEETSPARSACISNATKSGPAHATRGGSQETKKRAPQGARASRPRQRAAPHMPREVGRRRRRNEPRKERVHLECNKERPRTCHERW